MIVTKEQADAILAEVGIPLQCDACGKPFPDDDVRELAYGPLSVFVCGHCEWRIMRGREKHGKFSRIKNAEGKDNG